MIKYFGNDILERCKEVFDNLDIAKKIIMLDNGFNSEDFPSN